MKCAVLILTPNQANPSLSNSTGERIQVTVQGIKGNPVRIGTDAPDNVTILREELLEGLQIES